MSFSFGLALISKIGSSRSKAGGSLLSIKKNVGDSDEREILVEIMAKNPDSGVITTVPLTLRENIFARFTSPPISL